MRQTRIDASKLSKLHITEEFTEFLSAALTSELPESISAHWSELKLSVYEVGLNVHGIAGHCRKSWVSVNSYRLLELKGITPSG